MNLSQSLSTAAGYRGREVGSERSWNRSLCAAVVGTALALGASLYPLPSDSQLLKLFPPGDVPSDFAKAALADLPSLALKELMRLLERGQDIAHLPPPVLLALADLPTPVLLALAEAFGVANLVAQLESLAQAIATAPGGGGGGGGPVGSRAEILPKPVILQDATALPEVRLVPLPTTPAPGSDQGSAPISTGELAPTVDLGQVAVSAEIPTLSTDAVTNSLTGSNQSILDAGPLDTGLVRNSFNASEESSPAGSGAATSGGSTPVISPLREQLEPASVKLRLGDATDPGDATNDSFSGGG